MFPFVLGKDRMLRVSTEKTLDETLEIIERQLTEENSLFQYYVCGHTVEEYISNIEEYII